MPWSSYVITLNLTKGRSCVSGYTQLTVIGEEARGVFAKFKWDGKEDQIKNGRHIVNHEKYLIYDHRNQGSRMTNIVITCEEL